jgi:hypothetical protein
VIASTEASDRLVLPSEGPRLEKNQWRANRPLAPEFEPVLGMVGDFLQRQIASLQARARLSCWFSGTNDPSRVQRAQAPTNLGRS